MWKSRNLWVELISLMNIFCESLCVGNRRLSSYFLFPYKIEIWAMGDCDAVLFMRFSHIESLNKKHFIFTSVHFIYNFDRELNKLISIHTYIYYRNGRTKNILWWCIVIRMKIKYFHPPQLHSPSAPLVEYFLFLDNLNR